MSEEGRLDYRKLKFLIAKGREDEVLDILHERIDDDKHLNYLVIQSRRYYDINKQINKNTIRIDDANIEINKIVDSILNLLDELKANESEDQKFLTDKDEKTLGIEVIYNDRPQVERISLISQEELEQRSVILRFLKVFDTWYFSPLRIHKWGSRQKGFSDLKDISSRKTKSILEKLLKEGEVKQITSRRGNPLYKIR